MHLFVLSFFFLLNKNYLSLDKTKEKKLILKCSTFLLFPIFFSSISSLAICRCNEARKIAWKSLVKSLVESTNYRHVQVHLMLLFLLWFFVFFFIFFIFAKFYETLESLQKLMNHLKQLNVT